MTTFAEEKLTELGRQVIKDELIPALESGDYKKGKGLLRQKSADGIGETDTWCCLGVLTDLFVKKGMTPEAEFHPRTGTYCYTESGSGYQTMSGLTPTIQKLTGISGLGSFYGTWEVKEEGTDANHMTMNDLAELNDSVDTFQPVIRALKEVFLGEEA
jgi:hypothetical protein